MEKSSDSESALPMEFQITRRKRSNLDYRPRNLACSTSTITEEENAAQILIMISRDTSFFKPPPPKSKSSIKVDSSPKSRPVTPIKIRFVSRAESSVKAPSLSRPESSVRSSLHECSTCGKRFPSHQALGGHKTMHNRPSLKRKRPNSEAPLVNGVVPVLEKPGIIKKSESPLVPVVNGAVPLQEKPCIKTHLCKECGKMFTTGQALGGHMREHFKGVISPQKKKVKFEFDLNFPPEMQKACNKNNGGDGEDRKIVSFM